MIDKTKSILAILLGVLVAFSIVYSIFALVISTFEKPDIVTADEAKLYMIDENLVLNYTRFYYIEDCLDNLIKSAQMKKYNELYDIYMKDYKSEYTKDEVFAKLEKFSKPESNLKLKKAYSIKDSLYVAEFEIYNKLETIFIRTGTDKGKSYEFALIIEGEE